MSERQANEKFNFVRRPHFDLRTKLSADGRYWIFERIETWLLPRKYLDVISQNHVLEVHRKADQTSNGETEKNRE